MQSNPLPAGGWLGYIVKRAQRRESWGLECTRHSSRHRIYYTRHVVMVLIAGVIVPRSERRRSAKRTNLNKKNKSSNFDPTLLLFIAVVEPAVSPRSRWTKVEVNGNPFRFIKKKKRKVLKRNNNLVLWFTIGGLVAAPGRGSVYSPDNIVHCGNTKNRNITIRTSKWRELS